MNLLRDRNYLLTIFYSISIQPPKRHMLDLYEKLVTHLRICSKKKKLSTIELVYQNNLVRGTLIALVQLLLCKFHSF